MGASGPVKAGAALAVVGTWARNYLVAPRYRRRERLSLVAADGTRLAAVRLQGPPSAPCTVVVVHGFVNWSRTPRIYDFARRLARQVNVVVPDLRGHGRSGGLCSMGRDEPLDVAAAVAAAPPGLPVVTVGMSLGGASVALHAGTYGGVAGTVTISAPAWWGVFDRVGSSRVQRWISTARGRSALAWLLRTRVVANCEGVPDSRDVVAAVAPAFILIAHDPDDNYFGPEHAERIYEWAGEPKELWWLPGAGHGTDVLTPAFCDRLLDAILTKLAAAPGARATGTGASGQEGASGRVGASGQESAAQSSRSAPAPMAIR